MFIHHHSLVLITLFLSSFTPVSGAGAEADAAGESYIQRAPLSASGRRRCFSIAVVDGPCTCFTVIIRSKFLPFLHYWNSKLASIDRVFRRERFM
jgi:hypothetical protein